VTRRWVGAAAIGAASVVGYRKVLRPWHETWGATDEEVRSSLPGDVFTAEPAAQVTRAITIEAPPEDVWPWVVMLGADRGGFYSYDWLENLFGLGIHSTDRIVAEWQERAVGEPMLGDARGRGGWLVMEVRPNEALVVKTANLKTSQPVLRDEPPAFWEFTWAFVLQGQPDGTTRLLVRERVGFGNKVAQFLMSPIGLVSFVMTRKTMHGIKARAEALTGERSSQSSPLAKEPKDERQRGQHEGAGHDAVGVDRGLPLHVLAADDEGPGGPARHPEPGSHSLTGTIG